MRISSLFILVSLLFSNSASSSVIAIIDSGTDMEHEQIKPHVWINQGEIAGNNRDEDKNGYQDDIFGWNFPGSNNQVIDYSYLGTLNDDIRKFFDIQAKTFYGTVTQEDIDWMRAIRNDEEFIKRISIYGNFMHGTHVAGIAAKGSPNAKILAVKLIPTETKLPGQSLFSFLGSSLLEDGWGDRAKKYLLKKGLLWIAEQNVLMLEEIAVYVGNHKADIANGSFGTGYTQAQGIVAGVFKLAFKRLPTDEEAHEFASLFLNKLIDGGKRIMSAAPNTLFIFAAGNEGLDNDKYPSSPTNVKAVNQLSVAATIGRGQLAPFSNYGANMVEIAAPGVAINSAAPGDEYIKVSGTSQAAPYVANIASMIKDANPELNPFQMKTILLKTVDKKDFLKGIVKSSGVVNGLRAVRAAELSKTMKIDEAISSAMNTIEDIKDVTIQPLMSGEFNDFVLPLPSMFR